MLPDLPLGKIINESNSEYHARDAVSNTRLKVFAKSPLLYKMLYIDKSIPTGWRDVFEMGKAFHFRCEGRAVYRKNVSVLTKYEDFKSKEAREWRQRQWDLGKTIITIVDDANIERMVANFKANPLVMALLKNTEREVTWRARIGSYCVQCRTDRWAEKPRRLTPKGPEVGPYFVDFKTVGSLSDGDFEAAVSNYDYHWQEEFYKQVIGQVKGEGPAPVCYFVVTEKNAPWQTEVHMLRESAQNLARASLMATLKRLRHCYDTGVWAEPQTMPFSTDLRFWKKKEEQAKLGYSEHDLQIP